MEWFEWWLLVGLAAACSAGVAWLLRWHWRYWRSSLSGRDTMLYGKPRSGKGKDDRLRSPGSGAG